MTRRSLLKNTSLAALTSTVAGSLAFRLDAAENQLDLQTKSRIRHSVCRWCFQDTPLEELCKVGKDMGLVAIDLVNVDEFSTLKKYEMHGSMVSPAGLKDYLRVGFNDPKNHDLMVDYYSKLIVQSAEAGYKNVICFSGNRNGLTDEEGLENCANGLKKLMQLAERQGVTMFMELLNSKVDHHDYQCDHTTWGVQLFKKIGSPNFQLLYDIYHMQIMEGDVIRTIRDHREAIGHFHTAGVPGRHEIDDSQELNYPAIMRAIVELDYKGFVAQEFIPTHKDKIESLREAVKICDI